MKKAVRFILTVDVRDSEATVTEDAFRQMAEVFEGHRLTRTEYEMEENGWWKLLRRKTLMRST